MGYDTSLGNFNQFNQFSWNNQLGLNNQFAWNNQFNWNNQFGLNNQFGWNNQFNWNNQFTIPMNWNTPIGNNSMNWDFSGSTSLTSDKTPEEIEAESKRKIAENDKKRSELLNQKNELLAQQDTIAKQEKILAEGIQKEDGSIEIKGEIKEDGTIKEAEKEDLSKMSIGAKWLRGLGNAMSGMGNVCKSLIGFDSTGKWDPVKCLKNVAIGVGVGALCVFAAPLGAAAAAALGGGAIAAGVGTAVAAIPAALATAGVATGAYMAGKGAIDTTKALNNNDIDAFDKATQDIGAGGFIGLTSAAGLRGMCKAAGMNAAAEAGATNTASSGFLGSIKTGIPNGLKDTFVNPWKVARSDFNIASGAYTPGTKFYSLKALNSGKQLISAEKARAAEAAFTRQKDNLIQNLEREQTANSTSATYGTKESALQHVKNEGLYQQQSRIETAATKTDWKNLSVRSDYKKALKGYLKDLKGGKDVEINGYTFKAGNKAEIAELEAAIKSANKVQSEYASQLAALKTQKFTTMKTMAKSNAHATEVESFGLSTKWYSEPLNWAQSKYYGFSAPTTKMKWAWKVVNDGFMLTTPEFLLQGTIKKPVAAYSNGSLAFNPVYEVAAGTVMTAEQVEATRATYAQANEQIKAGLEQINSQLKQLA